MSRLKSHEFTPSKFCHTKTVSWAFFLNCLTQCLCFHLPKTLKKAFTLKWSWSMTAQFLVLTSLPRYSTVVQTDCCQNISLRNMSSCIYNIVHFQTMHTVGQATYTERIEEGGCAWHCDKDQPGSIERSCPCTKG